MQSSGLDGLGDGGSTGVIWGVQGVEGVGVRRFGLDNDRGQGIWDCRNPKP